jgi:succinate-semialdehyde dehydrogenase/glutarate-semialdehyde dehydrogenase
MINMKSINPYTGEVIAQYEIHTQEEINHCLDKSVEAFKSWKQTSFDTRRELLLKLADTLLAYKDKAALMATQEMGKVLKEAETELEKCTSVCHYYVEHGEKFLEEKHIETDYAKSYIRYEPLGPILAVMPWNFPFWQALRCAVPLLMAGNSYILKHASNVSGCALLLEEIFKEAGFPEGAFQTLLLPGKQLAPVIEDSRVAAVTLTGGVPAGKAVAKIAGGALKKTVLELGGCDAYLVLADADIDQAVDICVRGRFLNNGQSCIAAKRLVVDSSIHDVFVKKLTEVLSKKSYGDPLDPSNDLGPVASVAFRNEVHQQVQNSIAAGANCVMGGVVPDDNSACYPPTILTQVTSGMPAYHEEIFGPVVVVIQAEGEEDAIAIANDSVFGLGGGIITTNIEHGEHIARERIESGACYVNECVRSDPRLPFGGIKESGYGKELSFFGIYEFVNAKTICVNK